MLYALIINLFYVVFFLGLNLKNRKNITGGEDQIECPLKLPNSKGD